MVTFHQCVIKSPTMIINLIFYVVLLKVHTHTRACARTHTHTHTHTHTYKAIKVWLICNKLADHTCMGLFLGSLFSSIKLYAWYLPMPYCFNYYNFVIFLRSGHVIPPALFFFHIFLAIWILFWLHIHFRIVCSTFVKNTIEILGDYIESVDYFE